ncbi:MAG: hypothetical protein SFV54_26310 [Bryobacteraceae bacterium]|nr:hypothetical protein [Bryobacteraceae bacterium]
MSQEGRKITDEAVRAQVARIIVSEGFVRAPRMRRFLEFIVEETLAGRGNQLAEYTIGLAVFDRGAGFEPALDPIVRNDARRLRLKLLEYYRQVEGGAREEVLIEVPKGAYLPVFRCMKAAQSSHRVPIFDAERRLVSIISLDDLARSLHPELIGSLIMRMQGAAA